MIKYFLLVVFIFQCTLSYTQNTDTTYFNEDWAETSKDSAVYYRIGKRDAGMSEGKVTDYYKSGTVQMTGNFANFSRRGMFVWYYKNGHKKEEGIYSHDIYYIFNSWDEQQKKEVKNGSGTCLRYYENGAKKSKISYSYGERNGKNLFWYRNGQLMKEDSCVYGACWVINFWDKEGNKTISNGNGKYISYYSNGSEKAVGSYKNGKETDQWTWYYENGIVDTRGEYDQKGRKTGPWHWKYNNGKNYISSSYIKGGKDGADSVWYSNGQLKKTRVYKEGALVGEEKNYLDGKLITHDQSSSEELKEEETPAEYIGGRAAMVKYITDNINYPAEAVRKNIQGKVKVFFIVSNTGKVVAARVTDSAEESLDAEALRLIENMPDWIPATSFGIPVHCKIMLPINFTLP